MSVEVLSASGLAKSYKSRVVVRDLSLQVAQGEVVGLLGPNGAGKTTSFYMIVGLVSPDAGRIQLGSEDLTFLPMHKRAQRGVGYLPQEASVFRKLSVEDNIMAILETRDNLDRAAREQRLEELMEELRIAHVRKSLAAFKSPKRIITVDSINRAANGKLDYRALKTRALEPSASPDPRSGRFV